MFGWWRSSHWCHVETFAHDGLLKTSLFAGLFVNIDIINEGSYTHLYSGGAIFFCSYLQCRQQTIPIPWVYEVRFLGRKRTFEMIIEMGSWIDDLCCIFSFPRVWWVHQYEPLITWMEKSERGFFFGRMDGDLISLHKRSKTPGNPATSG